VREVEVKYRLVDPALAEELLAHWGIRFGSPVEQDDQAFARLRTECGRHVFTVKTPLANAQACMEHESEVVDRAAMHAAVQAMGFRPTVRIVKRRRTARYGGWQLCLDEVNGAGVFLELEALPGPDEDPAAVQQQLVAWVARLGLAAARVTQTYDSLVRAAHLVGV
jgi:adenylate cyclase class 2